MVVVDDLVNATASAGALRDERDVERPDESKGARTRRAILDAAISRFARDGFRSTSMSDIAREAGLSPTGAYPYFANKEALFFDAVDADSSALIAEGTRALAAMDERPDWRLALVMGLIDELDRHPLARRLLAGLEPEVTSRVLRIPALDTLRRQFSERIAVEQSAGRMRRDIDPATVGSGSVVILLSLLMSIVQIGPEAIGLFQHDVVAVFDAVFAPVQGDSRS